MYLKVWFVILVHRHRPQLGADLNHCIAEYSRECFILVETLNSFSDEVKAKAIVVLYTLEQKWHESVMLRVGLAAIQ